MKAVKALAEIPWFNSFTQELPSEFYTRTQPTPVSHPSLIAWTEDLGKELGLAQPQKVDESVEILSGNRIVKEMDPYASRYGGHQFGNWAGQLGDGRALTLGELKDSRGQNYEIQLKGSGQTEFSRRGDGRAVLRSSIREFLASEAMYHLGVSTTRALSLTLTGDSVLRDPFYDGHPQLEPGAICSRVAPTFVRFGNFEIFASLGKKESIEQLMNWVIQHHYPGLSSKEWFKEVCRRTALMIVQWMRVGFVHGVMNSDNMSILGLTIDYGPYGWVEPYDLDWTPNTTDLPGRRYAFGQQADVALWNLQRLADALSLILPVEDLQTGLNFYIESFNNKYLEMNRNKLGLKTLHEEADRQWIQDLNTLMYDLKADMTLFYRKLSRVHHTTSMDQDLENLNDVFYAVSDVTSNSNLKSWLQMYKDKIKIQNIDAKEQQAIMSRHNPKYILRNYMAFKAAVAAEKGDYTLIYEFQKMLSKPYEEQNEFEKWFQKRPEWAADQPGSSTLSCSS